MIDTERTILTRRLSIDRVPNSNLVLKNIIRDWCVPNFVGWMVDDPALWHDRVPPPSRLAGSEVQLNVPEFSTSAQRRRVFSRQDLKLCEIVSIGISSFVVVSKCLIHG